MFTIIQALDVNFIAFVQKNFNLPKNFSEIKSCLLVLYAQEWLEWIWPGCLC